MNSTSKSYLYELLLETNSSFYLTENCENFLTHLMKQEDFTQSWIYLKKKKDLEISYQYPQNESVLPEDFNQSLIRLHIHNFEIIKASSLNIPALTTGSILIYPLGNIGFLCIHSNLNFQSLQKIALHLNPVIDKFAIATLSCYHYHQMHCAKDHLRRIFNVPAIPMVIFDPKDLKIYAINKKALELYGYKEETILHKSLTFLFEENEKTRLIDKQQKSDFAFDPEKVWKHQLKNGSIVYVNLSENDVVYEGIKTKILVIKDLSLSKNALLIQEPGLFPEENPSPVLRFSMKKKKFEYCNKVGESIMQYLESPENTQIRTSFEHIMEKSHGENTNSQMEIQIHGKVYLCQFVPLSEHGYVNLYFHEVTSLKNIQKEISQREDKYKRVLENLELGLLEVDKDENIINAYPKFCLMTGYKKEELVGKNASEILVDQGVYRDKMKTVNESRRLGQSGVNEVQIRRKDGSKIWVMISGAPLYDENNKVVGSTGIHLDITERKQLENDLLNAKDMAEKSVQAKEIFMANMSHEIRTPMNAIIGFGELLQDASLNTNEKKYLEAMNHSAQNLLNIINDILDFSKINAGKLMFETVDFNLRKLFSNTANTLQNKANEKGIELISEVDEEIFSHLQGDPTRLSQVLINLTNNAIKFTQSGKVHLSANLKESNAQFNKVLFSVKDTGIGIQPDKLDTIFESFTQEEVETTRKYGGTGLGLAISKELVEKMKGKLEVESTPGVGSEFKFSLLFKKGKEIPELEIVHEQNAQDIQSKRILLVEDNPVNQLMATSMLEKWDCKVTIANDGWESIEHLKSGTYDLILMDMRMPNLNGLDATKIIREKLKSKIPIIALTANAIKGDKEKCLNAGMDDYLSKPFKSACLKAKLDNWLSPETTHSVELPEPEQKPTVDSTEDCLYDFSELYEMADDDAFFIDEMIQIFLEETSKDLENMNRYVVQKDFHQLTEIAHKLKPSLDHMARTSLRNEIREIESWEEKDHIMVEKTKKLMCNLESLMQQIKRYSA